MDDEISLGTIHDGYVYEVSYDSSRQFLIVAKYGGERGETMIESVTIPLAIAEEFAMDIFRVKVLQDAKDEGLLDG